MSIMHERDREKESINGIKYCGLGKSKLGKDLSVLLINDYINCPSTSYPVLLGGFTGNYWNFHCPGSSLYSANIYHY